jgi:hypothetical protein
MSHDPKLKEAMAEIKNVLNKHDLAGQVTLVSKTHSEFYWKIDPTWSCAKPEPAESGKVAIRFRATKKDIPDKEERRKLAELTLHLLCQIRDLNAQNFMVFDELLNQLGKVIDFEHKPYSGFEPHEEH